MDKLRIGIVIRQASLPTEGGGYSYHETLLKGINDFDFYPEIEFLNLVFYDKYIPRVNLKKQTIFIKSGLGNTVKDIIKSNLKKSGLFVSPVKYPIIDFFYKLVINKRNKQAIKILQHHKIDLLYYLSPEPRVLNYPFITTHWDVMHKSTYAFPEASLHEPFMKREKYYLYTLNKAFLILCESETGATELKKYYPLFPGKIKVLPIFGSNIIEHNLAQHTCDAVLLKYGLKKNEFFLYPAQFWPLKNHYNLLLAFKSLKKEINDPDLKLVLCGGDMGNFSYIKQVSNLLSLTDFVIMPGFISNDDLFVLYRNALALTMSTFLGPTNMPLMEAAHLHCPVLCSDIEGHREILGNTALYFNPSDSEEMKDCMKQVLDENIREAMATSAYNHIIHSPFNLNKSLHVLNGILSDTKSKRKTWGIDYVYNN